MARKPKSGKELSLHKSSKRWCKSYTIDGVKKTQYFEHGDGPNDYASYKKLLEQFRIWWPTVEVEKKFQKALSLVRDKLREPEAGDQIDLTDVVRMHQLITEYQSAKKRVDRVSVREMEEE